MKASEKGLDSFSQALGSVPPSNGPFHLTSGSGFNAFFVYVPQAPPHPHPHDLAQLNQANYNYLTFCWVALGSGQPRHGGQESDGPRLSTAPAFLQV